MPIPLAAVYILVFKSCVLFLSVHLGVVETCFSLQSLHAVLGFVEGDCLLSIMGITNFKAPRIRSCFILSNYSPKNERMSPENQWLEDVISY